MKKQVIKMLKEFRLKRNGWIRIERDGATLWTKQLSENVHRTGPRDWAFRFLKATS